MVGHDLLTDEQAQTRALTMVICAIRSERLEDGGGMGWINSLAMIFHANLQAVAIHGTPNSDPAGTLVRKLPCIVKQLEKKLFQKGRTAGHPGQ